MGDQFSQLALLPIGVLALVFILIAIRQVGRFSLQIWQVMLGGAIIVLVTGQISLGQAWQSIDWDVMLFLLGMFIVGQALEDSGYLAHISYKLFKRAKSSQNLLLAVIFVMGFSSALLMNDTIAIIGTPIVMGFAKKYKLPPKMLLLSLAFAITIGSVMSPMGNPQNLLIALHGNIDNPFVTFLQFLLVPTIINLLIAYWVLMLFFRPALPQEILIHTDEALKEPDLAKLVKVSMLLIVSLIGFKIINVFLPTSFEIRLTYIALIGAAPIVLFSRERRKILRAIDWHTLIFFIAMFILMDSVWHSGFFQLLLNLWEIDIYSSATILIISGLASQLISNVPLVALYLPMLTHGGAGVVEMMALASGSTIAGNLLILGAASNVIIIQNAEKKWGETLSFMEFAKVGTPVFILNILVYGLFLSFYS